MMTRKFSSRSSWRRKASGRGVLKPTAVQLLSPAASTRAEDPSTNDARVAPGQAAGASQLPPDVQPNSARLVLTAGDTPAAGLRHQVLVQLGFVVVQRAAGVGGHDFGLGWNGSHGLGESAIT